MFNTFCAWFPRVVVVLTMSGCATGDLSPVEPDPTDAGAGSPQTPEPTPSPTPESTPTPDAPSPDTPSPEATPTPETPSPEATPEPTPEPTPSPEATPEPTPEPTPSPESPSPGCGQAAPADGEWSVQSGGLTRTFNVHLPPNYQSTTPTALVLSFHGHAISATLQAYVDKLEDVADDEGFVVVHPQGTGTTPSWNAGACCGYAKDNNIDDVAFVDAMVAQLSASLCIDQKRIYADGLSNGGFFSYKLACERAELFAAISSVAGVTGVLQCNPSRPIPVQHFHGTSDLIVPYGGNFSIAYMSVDNNIENWRDRDGCTAEKTIFFNEDDVLCESWAECDDGAEVQLCTIDAGGHQWPGGWTVPGLGRKTNTISASRMMWDFFAAHPLP